MKKTLEAAVQSGQLQLTPAQIGQLCQYGAMLLEKNRVMNLTAITEPEAVAQLHFLDCLALLQLADFGGKKVIDIGCGAGFPGIPLLIAQPDLDLTLLDSTAKRIGWLREEVLPALGLQAQCVAARAEEYVSGCRETYAVAVSRAVANLRLLSELCLPLVKVGGQFLAMKSAGSDLEIDEAKKAIVTLGGKLSAVRDYPIPGTEVTHRLVVIEKVSPTPKKYPRPFAKIKKAPL